MARQRVTTTRVTIRKSKTYTDRKGRVHCKSCGAYISKKGKKK